MSAFLGLTPGDQLAPVLGLDLDLEPVGRGLDPLPSLVALAVADPFDLVEAGHGVADMGGVGERLLARLGEGELALGEVVLLGGAHPLGTARHPLALGAGALGCARLGQVLACGLLLLLGRHGESSRMVDDSLVATRTWRPEIGSGRDLCAALWPLQNGPAGPWSGRRPGRC